MFKKNIFEVKLFQELFLQSVRLKKVNNRKKNNRLSLTKQIKAKKEKKGIYNLIKGTNMQNGNYPFVARASPES